MIEPLHKETVAQFWVHVHFGYNINFVKRKLLGGMFSINKVKLFAPN